MLKTCIRTIRNSARSYSTLTKNDNLGRAIANEIKTIKDAGTYKRERTIITPQTSQIGVKESTEPVLNFCANNYLGLSDHPEVIKAAQETLKSRGFGMSSVRFICGTQDIHKELEKKISEFHRTEDTILYSSAFDANAGFFEAILGEQDAVISDALNHASIIDGIRLCKAKRFRYKHLDMKDLENYLQQSQDCRIRMIVTDGIFSMDGDVAPLDKIVALAEKVQFSYCMIYSISTMQTSLLMKVMHLDILEKLEEEHQNILV
jgi:glycine C-acetyltransferase